jgi:hypothetical protein
MGGGGGTQETRTELDPTFKPKIEYALNEAQRLYKKMPKAPSTLAPEQSQYSIDAIQKAAERAQAGSPLLSQAQQSLTNVMGAADPSASFYAQMMQGGPESEAMRMARATASGQYLQPNEFLSGALAQANRLAGEQYNKNIQALQSQASSAGRYGSAAQRQQTGQAQDVFARALAEQNQQAYLQNYAQERAAQEAAIARLGGFEQQAIANQMAGAQGLTAGQQQALQTQLSAAQVAPQLAAADYADIQSLLKAGQAQEGYAQQAIQGQLAAQDIPLERLTKAANVFYGAPLESKTTATPQGGK